MKTLFRFFTAVFLSLCTLPTLGQQDVEYQIKILRYQSMEHTGKVLTVIGISSASVGTAFAIAGSIYYNSFDFPNFNDSDDIWDDYWKKVTVSDWMTYGGIVVGGLGVISLVNGIIFKNVGKRKTEEYQFRLDNLNISSYYTPEHSGINITYKF